MILGAGAAGIGIARLIRATLRAAGLQGEALVRATANLDSHGLLVDDQPVADRYKADFVWPAALARGPGLRVRAGRGTSWRSSKAVKPTMLIGTSGEPGTFGEGVVREMARHVERPLIFPMSNPTSKSEAKPADLIAWTDGRALVATGSPFEPVEHGGRSSSLRSREQLVHLPRRRPGRADLPGARGDRRHVRRRRPALATEVRQGDLAVGSLFPPVRDLGRVTAAVAEAVVREARDSGIGRVIEDGKVPRRSRRTACGTPPIPPWKPISPEAPIVAEAEAEPARV